MKKLNRVQKKLLAQFFVPLILALGLIVLFETETLVPGACTEQSQTEFIWLSVMEIVTICCIPLSLRLFKFKKIQAALQHPAASLKALLVWGSCRLAMLTIPMLVNTILYYLFMKVAFGYLAIILFLCLFFIFPSIERCMQETKDVKQND